MSVTGPPIGNQPLPDSYIRLKQNIETLQQGHAELNKSLADLKGTVSEMDKKLAQYQKLLTVRQL
jgi:prefoldin subunit 5